MHVRLELPLLLPEKEDCQRCLDRLRDGIGRIKGVGQVGVSQDGANLSVRFDPNLTNAELIQEEALRIGVGLGIRYAHEVMELEGLDCADCAPTLERMLSRKEGILWVAVNFPAATLEVEFEPQKIRREQIETELRHLGYGAVTLPSPGPGDTWPLQASGTHAPKQPRTHRHTSVLYIPEMDCDEEIALIRKKLGSLGGVDDLEFNLVSKKLTAIHRLDPEAVLQALREIKMSPQTEEILMEREVSFWEAYRRLLLTCTSGVLSLAGFILALAGSSLAVTIPLYAAAIALGGWLMARKAYYAVRNLTLDINVLMSLAVIGAAAIGDWLEGATVIFLFSLANLLESYSMQRARRSIKALMELAPSTARVRRNGEELTLPAGEVRVGELIAVRPGERIPLDGVITEGSSSVDQSPITGESIPVERAEGQEVYGGTINGRGYLELKVTRLSRDTTLARIIHSVEEAQSRKAPSQSFVDRFARFYTPAVVLAALLIALLPPLIGGLAWGVWFYRALVLLVVACPCALVISTPVTIVSGLARATREGILIKGGIHLESLGSLKAFAFDKTGTLTAGKPRVSGVEGLNGHSEQEVLRVAAAIEARSEHPLAGAILEHARGRGVDIVEARDFLSMAGKGAAAAVEGRRYYLGNHRLFEELGWCYPEVDARLNELEAGGQTAVIVGDGKALTGIISIADQPREEARRALEELKGCGVRRTLLLTGDNRATARAIAGRLGLDGYRAELLPEDKVAAVRELVEEHGGAAMVGDGVNDAPALAAATVGIAMGAAGTDAALETADVALMADDLTKLPLALRLSRRVSRIIRQNIAFSILIKAVFIALTPLGFTSLWLAVLADMGASLLVIFNGLRALKK